VARVKRSSAAGAPSSARRGGIQVPGIYGRLLQQEQNPRPDPRRKRTADGQTVEPCPEHLLPRSRTLQALEAGEPVDLPGWRLGGHSEPDERIRRLQRQDRSIVGWLVYADDTVVPQRNAR
jgi:hypothetical protein